MPDFRRYFVPGGSFFFTVVTYNRRPLLCSDAARQVLRDKLRECRDRWPFTIDAIVLLPDHLHAMWSLPPGDAAYTRRWGWIKKEFTMAWLDRGGHEASVTRNQSAQRRHGVWQARYWEHTLEDEHDFERHFDYLHYNPVKHGYVTSPRDWPYSSFHRWVDAGVYEAHWGSGSPLNFDDLDETAME